MIAHITDTEVDLYHPDLDPHLSFICGYHAIEATADARYATWKQAALTTRELLLITGRREIPTGPSIQAAHPQVSYHQIWEVLHESHVAVVTTTPDHPAPLTP
jgi:hypothetical protein